jgi:quercetin dioxygenase-like cupin family protein
MDLGSTLPATIRALPVTVDEPRHVVRRLAGPGCEVLFVTASGGFGHPMHDHDTENVTVVVSGGLTLQTENGVRKVGPGEWYQTQPGELHGIRFETDTLAVELRFSPCR